MILTYYPDTDTLDVDFDLQHQQKHETQEQAAAAARRMLSERSEKEETATHDAEPTGQTLAHYCNGRLHGLTIEHAHERAPAAWDVDQLRKEAAQVAASTGRVVEHITYDIIRDRKSIQTGQQGPHSPHTSDEAVRAFNQLIDHYRETTPAA